MTPEAMPDPGARHEHEHAALEGMERPSLESPTPGMLGLGLTAGASPAATPLSMDLTNTSLNNVTNDTGDFKFSQPSMGSTNGSTVPSQEYTRNITSHVPALSTLVEEDEDSGFEHAATCPPVAGVQAIAFSRAHVKPPAARAAAAVAADSRVAAGAAVAAAIAVATATTAGAAAAVTAAAALASAGAFAGAGKAGEHATRRLPALGCRPADPTDVACQPVPAAGDAGGRPGHGGHPGPQEQGMRRPSVYYMRGGSVPLCRMLSTAALVPHCRVLPTAGFVPSCRVLCIIRLAHWGFTPGAEDTLNMSNGRFAIGEQTYNQVYGNALTGDVTLSMRANNGAGAATCRFGCVARSFASEPTSRSQA
eukprot:364779-Chlamydomonas_euryale.AAC.5